MRTLIAVRIAIKAIKKGNKYIPCGLAAPRKSITGKCHKPQKKPRITLDFIKFCFKHSFGKAYPVHPISSKKPAGDTE